VNRENRPGKASNLTKLTASITALKKKGKTIALANGGFDLFHVGHARYLLAAASQADILVVAVNSDASLKRLKGPNRPILEQKERIAILQSVEGVDFVVPFGEQTVAGIIRAIKPNVHCKGSDYTPETVPEADVVRSIGGRVAIVGGDKVRSTSWLMNDPESSGL